MGRLSRWPAEWLYSFAVIGVALWVLVWVEPQLLPLQLQIYRNLATAFVAGWLLVFALSYGDQLLRPLPRSRCWRQGALGAVTFSALWLFATVRTVTSSPVSRLMESFALCAMVAAAVLTLFLPVSGFLGFRATGRVMLRSVRFWSPLMVYLLVCGLALAAVTQATPLVWDPVLLRMDVSLGFNPSEVLFRWERDHPWVGPLSNWSYPLLGFLIAAIAARIWAGGAVAQARRAVFAILLVGTLGIVCYALVPALSPIYAFPELFQPPGPSQSATANLVREVALTGPRQIPASWENPRNTMPSLHTAFTLVALASAWGWRRSFFWLCLPLGLLQIITTMTLYVHYLVDLFAAVPFATFCWWLADLGVRHTGAEDERLPAPPRMSWRAAALFLASLALSLGLFLAWARFAPIPPALAWPLAVVATALPVVIFFRTNNLLPCGKLFAGDQAVHRPLAATADDQRQRREGQHKRVFKTCRGKKSLSHMDFGGNEHGDKNTEC